jgi:hypothetical protein
MHVRCLSTLALGLGVLGLATFASPSAAEPRGGQGYQLEVVAPAEGKPGEAATATVTVRTRGGWKLSTDYPFKLELAPPAGVRVAKTVLRKDDARRFVDSGLDIDVVFTPDKAGRSDIGATVKFATCDGESCAVHKETFTIPTVR